MKIIIILTLGLLLFGCDEPPKEEPISPKFGCDPTGYEPPSSRPDAQSQ